MFTVLIVDDHPLFRRGVAQLLEMEPDIKIVGEASNGAEALALANAHAPDLILLDLQMKDAGGAPESGIDVLAALKRDNPDCRVVMLTVSDAPDHVADAMRAGADGYLLKDMDPEALVAQVRAALGGEVVLGNTVGARLAMALRAQARRDTQTPATAPQRDLSQLTDREQAVLRCVAEGQPNKAVARALNITEATVKVHLKHLMKKLNFRSRVEAAVWMSSRLGGAAGTTVYPAPG
jgi:two-component system nitrate/nitrite response regulator NarL